MNISCGGQGYDDNYGQGRVEGQRGETKLECMEPEASLGKIPQSLGIYTRNWKTWFLPLESK